jgi:GH15 family glucan-1,4-alpha-glucosidase
MNSHFQVPGPLMVALAKESRMTERTVPGCYPPIGDYAVIGDCHTAALISRAGSVDWYCPRRFDHPAVLCRLLDAGTGGFFRLAPSYDFTTRRRYRPETNVLESTFTTDTGVVRVTDFMPIHRRTAERHGQDVGASGRLLRLVEGIRGTVDLGVAFKPSFDFGRAPGNIQVLAGRGAIARSRAGAASLAVDGIALRADAHDGVRGRLRVRAGDRRWLALGHVDGDRPIAPTLDSARAEAELAQTIAYWQRWSGRCTYRGPYRDAVLRSALTLKLLTYEPSGAVVAAPTTSLPEQIGGLRNWDYRFTWLRDAALILYALLTLGFHAEADDFMAWLERACGDDPTATPQIMYGITGERDLREVRLDHLDGYRGSRPVRIGNAAAGQRQLDIYGEVLVAAYLQYRAPSGPARDGTRPRRGPSPDVWALLRRFVDQAAACWQRPDRGIWELRDGPRHFLYSKLMCWAALDRGVRLAEEHDLPGPLARWRRTRTQIRAAILRDGYNRTVGAFTQSFGSTSLDASALAIPRIGFLPATDPRVLSTIERIRADLTADGLVYRYRTPDGLPRGEGAFALCTFWLVDALALTNRLEEARVLFEHVLGYANDVGLLSEEIDPASGSLLGNFPQGFSHLALIGAAVNLAKAAKYGAEHTAETEAERAGRAGAAAAEGYAARADGASRLSRL